MVNEGKVLPLYQQKIDDDKMRKQSYEETCKKAEGSTVAQICQQVHDNLSNKTWRERLGALAQTETKEIKIAEFEVPEILRANPAAQLEDHLKRLGSEAIKKLKEDVEKGIIPSAANVDMKFKLANRSINGHERPYGRLLLSWTKPAQILLQTAGAKGKCSIQ